MSEFYLTDNDLLELEQKAEIKKQISIYGDIVDPELKMISEAKKTEYMRRWRSDNRDHINEYHRNYMKRKKKEAEAEQEAERNRLEEERRKKRKEYLAKYRELNREKINEYHRQYVADHLEEITEYQRKYQKQYQEKKKLETLEFKYILKLLKSRSKRIRKT